MNWCLTQIKKVHSALQIFSTKNSKKKQNIHLLFDTKMPKQKNDKGRRMMRMHTETFARETTVGPVNWCTRMKTGTIGQTDCEPKRTHSGFAQRMRATWGCGRQAPDNQWHHETVNCNPTSCGFCGRSVARVSATLVIDVRERFISAACRLYGIWKRCSLYSVVLDKVVLSRWCFVLWWIGREKVRQRPAKR